MVEPAAEMFLHLLDVIRKGSRPQRPDRLICCAEDPSLAERWKNLEKPGLRVGMETSEPDLVWRL